MRLGGVLPGTSTATDSSVPGIWEHQMRRCVSTTLKLLCLSTLLWLPTQSQAFLLGLSQGRTSNYNQASRGELDNEEPLSVIFQRAVVLQRAGSHSQALDEYFMFLKAAAQCQVDPSMYAEVYVNMGALYLRKQDYEKAKEHFVQALEYRPKFGTAHVNLAVVALQQASSLTSISDAVRVRKLLKDAKQQCEMALECNTDPRSVAMAKRLLEDIEGISAPPLQ